MQDPQLCSQMNESTGELEMIRHKHQHVASRKHAWCDVIVRKGKVKAPGAISGADKTDANPTAVVAASTTCSVSCIVPHLALNDWVGLETRYCHVAENNSGELLQE